MKKKLNTYTFNPKSSTRQSGMKSNFAFTKVCDDDSNHSSLGPPAAVAVEPKLPPRSTNTGSKNGKLPALKRKKEIKTKDPKPKAPKPPAVRKPKLAKSQPINKEVITESADPTARLLW